MWKIEIPQGECDDWYKLTCHQSENTSLIKMSKQKGKKIFIIWNENEGDEMNEKMMQSDQLSR